MPGHHFKFAISTLSCAPANIFAPHQILISHLATTTTINRLIAFKQAVSHFIPPHDCSASLHVGYLLNTETAINLLHANNIPISSLDTPDVRSLPAFTLELIRNIIVDMSFKKIKTTIGWQFASVTTMELFRKKVREGMKGINSQDNVHLIRTSISSFRQDRVGKELLRMITHKQTHLPTIGLALEIDARRQTPEEYFEFVYKLNQKNPTIPIYFDLDIGHLAEARLRHRHKDIEKPEIIIEKLLSNKKYCELIGMISLNQYDHEQDETHISLLKGSIDYIHIMKLLGQAGRSGYLPFDPIVMAEFSPFAYDEMISLEGIKYFYQLKKAYCDNNLSIRAVLKPTTTSSSIHNCGTPICPDF